MYHKFPETQGLQAYKSLCYKKNLDTANHILEKKLNDLVLIKKKCLVNVQVAKLPISDAVTTFIIIINSMCYGTILVIK